MSSMRTLISNIDTYLKAGVNDGSITAGTDSNTPITTGDIYIGVNSLPDLLPRRPYITLDDGGERVENITIDAAHDRIYSVIFEMGIYIHYKEDALLESLDFSDQVKTVVEKEANRQLDGHLWGISINTFGFETDQQGFYRVRQVVVDFMENELQPFDSY
jgi:hypothetical protein